MGGIRIILMIEMVSIAMLNLKAFAGIARLPFLLLPVTLIASGAAAALLTPVSVVAAVVLGALPWPCLAAALPSVLLRGPLSWALKRPEEPVPLPALGANVGWNLATNTVMALGLVAAVVFRIPAGG